MTHQTSKKLVYYWENFIKKEVEFLNKRHHFHYYNEIPYTMWPFYISEMLFVGIYFGILFLNGVETGILSIIGLSLVAVAAFLWFYDILVESMIFGKYNRKLRRVIVVGFALFLISEVFVFIGFFWAFFDRFFHNPALLGGISIPMGLEIFVSHKKPLYATIILLYSTIAFNGANYAFKWSTWTLSIAYSLFGLLLGRIFLAIQVTEYKHLSFNITDTVYGSCFYLLTGFHGFHVVVGLIFLTTQHDRLISWSFSQERHLGYILAMLYWHFVDIVWIFLFIFVYYLNNKGYPNYLYV